MASVRQQIKIAAAPRAVWRALTTADGLTSWWCDVARVDARAGGRIVLTTGEREQRGMVHVCRPTRRIEIAWDAGSEERTAGGRVKFDVARDGTETRVAVVASGGAALEDEEEHAVEDEWWKTALKKLRVSLEG